MKAAVSSLLLFISLHGTLNSVCAEDADLLKTCRGDTIPPRVSHFNGVGAHGYFETSSSPHPDIAKYTKARLFQGASMRTPIFVRFSQAAQDPVLPDAKGFSIRFFTDDGLLDIVGQHISTFPLSDMETFQKMAASSKYDPNTHQKDVNGYWTFTTMHPQTLLHNVMLFSSPLADPTPMGLGYPTSFRFVGGGAIHTYKLVNDKGETFWARFNWMADQMGVAMSNQTNLNHATMDLYDSIRMGDMDSGKSYPSWSVVMQVMTMQQIEDSSLTFDPFDLTQMWPMETYPAIPLGKMVLNRNPDDYSSDVEMIAFDPAKLPPGVELSPPEVDVIMPLRIGAYKAMQAKRLPPHPEKLPINGGRFNPKMGSCGASTGPMMMSGDEKKGMPMMKKARKLDFNMQAQAFYKALKPEDQQRLAQNIAGGLKGTSMDLCKKAVEYFKNASDKLAKDVEGVMMKMMKP